MKPTLLIAAIATTAVAATALPASAQRISISIGPQYTHRQPAPVVCYPAPVTTVRYVYGPTVQTYSYPAPQYYYPQHRRAAHHYRTAAPRGWVPAYYNPGTRQTYIPRHNARQPHRAPRITHR